jgi:phosphatidylserine synthase
MSAEKIVDIRKVTYYYVCVVIRLVIIAIVYTLRNSRIVQGLVMVGALVGIVNLGRRYEGNQWWSKKFQLLMSCIIVILVILTFFKYVESWTIPMAMAVSLGGGVLQSFMIRFC